MICGEYIIYDLLYIWYMIDGKRYNGLLVDIWSCGIVLFAMICGFLPFDVK